MFLTNPGWSSSVGIGQWEWEVDEVNSEGFRFSFHLNHVILIGGRKWRHLSIRSVPGSNEEGGKRFFLPSIFRLVLFTSFSVRIEEHSYMHILILKKNVQGLRRFWFTGKHDMLSDTFYGGHLVGKPKSKWIRKSIFVVENIQYK